MTELVTVELDPPEVLRGRWAGLAAVTTAPMMETAYRADGPDWFHEDGGGSHARLHWFDDGRALLWGWDRDFSRTSDETPERPGGVDLYAGAPGWWQETVVESGEENVGFVYGFQDGVWRRAEYGADVDPADDGFGSTCPWLINDHQTVEQMSDYTDGSGYDVVVPEVGRSLIASCGLGPITQQLAASVWVGEQDLHDEGGPDHRLAVLKVRRFHRR